VNSLFAEFDKNEPRGVESPNLEGETRPFLFANLGKGTKHVIFYPPSAYIGMDLSFNQLTSMMKENRTVPLRMGDEMIFVGWDETRLFFGNTLDQFLVDAFNILPTDTKEKEDA